MLGALFLAANLVISHAGRLLDQDDHGVSGTVNFTFLLYAKHAPDPGETETPLWTSSVETTVVAGLYAVNLGEAAASPLASTLFDPGAERWLAVKVGDGPVLTPRLRIGSVPNAVAAAHAGRADEATHAGAADEATHAAKAALADEATHALDADNAADAAKLAGKPPGYYSDAANLAGTLGPGVTFRGAPLDDAYVKGAEGWSAKLDAVTTAAPLSGDGRSSPIAMPRSTKLQDGFLHRDDFDVFSRKISSLSAGPGISIGSGVTPTIGAIIGTTDGTVAAGNDARFPAANAFIANGTSQQASANFNISGAGTLGGKLTVGGDIAANGTVSIRPQRGTMAGFTCDSTKEGMIFYDPATFAFFGCANGATTTFSASGGAGLPAVTSGLVFNLDAATYVSGTNLWKDNSGQAGPNWTLNGGMDALWNAGGWFALNGGAAHALNVSGTTAGVRSAYTIEILGGFLVAGSSTIIEQTSDNSGGNRDIASLKWGTGPCGTSTYMMGSTTASGAGVACLSGGSINTSGWSYFQSTYDGSNVRWFENRNARGTFARTGNTTEMKFFYIGKGGFPAAGEAMNGRLAVVRMYSRALSDTELQANYNALKSRFSLP